MSQWNGASAKLNLPTTVSSALAESWSSVVFMMQVYTPASFSVTSVMVRLSESTINLETKHVTDGSAPQRENLEKAKQQRQNSWYKELQLARPDIGFCCTLKRHVSTFYSKTGLYSELWWVKNTKNTCINIYPSNTVLRSKTSEALTSHHQAALRRLWARS